MNNSNHLHAFQSSSTAGKLFRMLTLTATLSMACVGTATAATFNVTEGNGQNRDLVANSVDLEDASPGGTGYDLDTLFGGSFGPDDTIGIYGRIVSSTDRFTYSFTSVSAFDVSFDFDGYDLDAGGSVAAGYSGLIDQSVVENGGDPNTTGGGKGVVIRLLDDMLNIVASASYITNVTSLTALDPFLFSGSAGTWTLVVDGSAGPNKSTPALYDIEISAVPLPAALPLLLSALGLFGFMGWRRKKTARA